MNDSDSYTIDTYKSIVNSDEKFRGYSELNDRIQETSDNYVRKKKYVPRVDCVILLDVTASMSEYILAAKQSIRKTVEGVQGRFPGAIIRWGCIAYRDIGDEKHFEEQGFTENLDNLYRFLNQLQAKNYTLDIDEPEDLTGALDRCLRGMWWKSPVRVCIIVADSPCHGIKFHNLPSTQDRFPNGHPKGLDPLKVLIEMRKKQINIFFMKISEKTNQMIDLFQRHYDTGEKYTDWKLQILPLALALHDRNERFLNHLVQAVTSSISLTGTRTGTYSSNQRNGGLFGFGFFPDLSIIKNKSLKPSGILEKVPFLSKSDQQSENEGINKLYKEPPHYYSSEWDTVPYIHRVNIYTCYSGGGIAGTLKLQILPTPFDEGSMRFANWCRTSDMIRFENVKCSTCPEENYLPSNTLGVLKEGKQHGMGSNSKEAHLLDLDSQRLAFLCATEWNNTISPKLRNLYFAKQLMKCGHQFQNYEEWKKIPTYVPSFTSTETMELPSSFTSSTTSTSAVSNNPEINFNGRIEFLPAVVLQLMDGRSPDREYVMFEPKLEGDFRKFSDNKGFVDDCIDAYILQAFSHWTFQYSNSEFMITDLQGCIVSDYTTIKKEKTHKYKLTDPQVHSMDRSKFGRGNLGEDGMASFFAVHKCNEICHFLELYKPGQMDKFLAVQVPVNKNNTSPSNVATNNTIITDNTASTTTSSVSATASTFNPNGSCNFNNNIDSIPVSTIPSAPPLSVSGTPMGISNLSNDPNEYNDSNAEVIGSSNTNAYAVNVNNNSNSVEPISLLHIPEAIAVIPEEYTQPVNANGEIWKATSTPISEPRHWMKDNEVFRCQLKSCKREFDIYHRRHHCRLCGLIVCHECSKTRLPLDFQGGNMERVCIRCIKRILGGPYEMY